VVFLTNHPVTGGYPMVGVVGHRRPCRHGRSPGHGRQVRLRVLPAPDLG